VTAVQPSGPLAPALITDADAKKAGEIWLRNEKEEADGYFPKAGFYVPESEIRHMLDRLAPQLHDRWVAEALERLAACWRPESDVRAAILANAAEYRATGGQS
jgi:hypothetical protein